MRREYLCPHCRKLLNPGSSVVLVVEHDAQRELILLSPVLGEYSIVYPASFDLELGIHYTFRCPLCHANLASAADQRLVEIHSRSEIGAHSRVSFSRVFGERATLVHDDDEHVKRFGEHADRYEQ